MESAPKYRLSSYSTCTAQDLQYTREITDPKEVVIGAKELEKPLSSNCTSIVFTDYHLDNIHTGFVPAVNPDDLTKTVIQVENKSDNFGQYLKLEKKTENTFNLPFTILTGLVLLEFNKDPMGKGLLCTGKNIKDKDPIKPFNLPIGVSFAGNEEYKDKAGTVSKKHLRIHYDGSNKVCVMDHGRTGEGSTNGSWYKKDVIYVEENMSAMIRLSEDCFIKVEYLVPFKGLDDGMTKVTKNTIGKVEENTNQIVHISQTAPAPKKEAKIAQSTVVIDDPFGS
jgi:hypothetical protein